MRDAIDVSTTTAGSATYADFMRDVRNNQSYLMTSSVKFTFQVTLKTANLFEPRFGQRYAQAFLRSRLVIYSCPQWSSPMAGLTRRQCGRINLNISVAPEHRRPPSISVLCRHG